MTDITQRLGGSAVLAIRAGENGTRFHRLGEDEIQELPLQENSRTRQLLDDNFYVRLTSQNTTSTPFPNFGPPVHKNQ